MTETPPFDDLLTLIDERSAALRSAAAAASSLEVRVPGCPDWSEHVTEHGNNSTSPNFGCAVNGNLAAMIADPQQLLHGAAGTGDTVIMSSTKAIQSYREAKPTGAGGLPEVSSQSSGGSK